MSTPAYTGITRWLVTLTVILVAVVEVLDMTIVNVSLPNMMGALGANTEQITWVLTSYVVSAAICMPLTGFLVNAIGQKKLLLINIIGFLISSALCGLSVSLPEMVFFRVLQGIFGASLVPLSQTILREAFPQKEQGKAMAIWGIGIMAAPVLGPTLGGYITEISNWRWVFYINIPVCGIAFLLAWQLIKENSTARRDVDWTGLILMAVGIGCLQIFLDRGNQEDWFSSNAISLLFVIWTVTLAVFIWRGLRIQHNIVDLKLFFNRNFSSGCLLVALYSIGVFGIISIQPIMLENYLHYSTLATGLIMAPRGFCSAISMGMVAALIKKYDPRYIIVCGLIISGIGSVLMSGHAANTDYFFPMWTSAIQGFGMGLFFVPISIIAFTTLDKSANAEAAGLFSFSRNLGISIGISILSTLLSRESQTNWNQLGGHIQAFNPNLTYWLQHQRWQLHQPLTLNTLANELFKQAGIIAFNDIFFLTGILFFVLLPLVFIIKKPDTNVNLGAMGH